MGRLEVPSASTAPTSSGAGVEGWQGLRGLIGGGGGGGIRGGGGGIDPDVAYQQMKYLGNFQVSFAFNMSLYIHIRSPLTLYG